MSEVIARVAGELEERAARFVSKARLPGASVGIVHGSELAWSEGIGFCDVEARRRPDPTTPYAVASITKTFTCTAIMRLAAAGAIDLEQPITTYLPEMRNADTSFGPIEVVTIRRMLSHESGLTEEPPGTDWTAPVAARLITDALARVGEIGTKVPPDSQSKYSNLAYQLLGEVVARTSGVPYTRYVAEQILEPLGMGSSAFMPLPAGIASIRATGYRPRRFTDEFEPASEPPSCGADGGLWSTTQDMAKWIAFQLAAHAAPAADSPVLAASARRLTHEPRFLVDAGWTTAMGICWFAIRRDGVVWIQHSGGLDGWASNICFDPASKVGAIVLLNASGGAAELAMDLASIARREVEAMAPEIRAAAPTPEACRSLLGFYVEHGSTEILRVEWLDGSLVVLAPSEPAWRANLGATEVADRFVIGPGIRQSGERVTFHRRDDGTVDSMLFAFQSFARMVPAT